MQKSVLIVENDANQARIIRKYLENNGFEVACFVDSSEALENFYLDVNYYAIVLTDFRLKGMSGTKFASGLKNSIIIIVHYCIYLHIRAGQFLLLDHVINSILLWFLFNMLQIYL